MSDFSSTSKKNNRVVFSPLRGPEPANATSCPNPDQKSEFLPPSTLSLEHFLQTGLTSAEVRKRLEKFGPNELKKRREFSEIKLFFSQFKSPLIYILILAGGVTLFLGALIDSVVILAAVFLNTILGFFQERKAQKTLMALRSLLTPKAKVIRGGHQQIVEAKELVPGDLVILTIGTRVPADGVLVEATDLSVEEAILTGESMPVKKRVSPHTADGGTAESKNTSEVKMGTTVVTGIAKMIVTKTGMETEMGKIAGRLEKGTEEETPLQKRIKRLAQFLAYLVGFVCFSILIVGILTGKDFASMFTTAVALAVASIPEGLVVSLTVLLAIGMQRILKRKALVRKLLAAETLGSVTVICADKTGTLTEGKMRLIASHLRGGLGRPPREREEWLVKAAVLCNDMRDPLEVEMMKWAKKKFKIKNSKFKIEDWQRQYPRIDEIPFDPKYKYIATLHRHPRGVHSATPGVEEDDYVLFLSGAPEVVLSKCKMQKAKGKIWLKKFEEYGRKGYRLVGFAWKKIHPRGASPRLARGPSISGVKLENLQWLGILLYEDPIRKGVKEALKECQRAGIKVKVITGDYALTAIAVLKKLGLFTGSAYINRSRIVMEGGELERISEAELRRRVDEVVLFARTNPEQKLKIVQALKDKGEVVAMMGDGVNDAPALKMADIGIVVSEASDVARETADMVLLDSNFATIVHAIKEGRGIFENLKKIILYLLADSFAEIFLVVSSLIFAIPLPLTAAQILWINLVSDGLPDLALTVEPRDEGLMRKPPRDPETPLVDLEIKLLILLVSLTAGIASLGVFVWFLNASGSVAYARTVAFTMLGVNSLVYVFSCRSLKKPIWHENFFKNPWLLLAVGGGAFLQISALYLPFFRKILETVILGGFEWMIIFLAALLAVAIIEGVKLAFLKLRRD